MRLPAFREFTLAVLLLSFPYALAQDPAAPAAPQDPQPPAAAAQATPSDDSVLNLLIGAGDEGDLSVFGVPEMTQHFRVSSDGQISLPLVGRVHVAGMSASAAQDLIAKKLQDGGFVRDPQVLITIKDYSSEGVSVLGEVQKPGTYSILSARRLYDAIQAAGGLTQRAGTDVVVTHRDGDTAQTFKMSDDPVKAAASNAELQPGDTIVVRKAGIVYVLGEVTRPGGFVLENRSTIPTSELLALAAGPTRVANLKHSRLLRRTPDGLQTQEINIAKIIKAESPDLALKPDDIIFIPPSKGKLAIEHGTSSIFGLLTQAAIYRF